VAIILIIATIALPALLRSRQVANESHAVANLRTLNTAEVSYLTSYKQYGSVPELVAAGLLDFRYSSGTGGYDFDVQTTLPYQDYTAVATAQSANLGRYDFITGSDLVIRYATDPARAPTGLSGEPVR
jgi:type II secretory pathway pseudopilin PulG